MRLTCAYTYTNTCTQFYDVLLLRHYTLVLFRLLLKKTDI